MYSFQPNGSPPFGCLLVNNFAFHQKPKMAARIPCHRHPSSSSSSMAMICPRSSTRQSSFRFRTSAHGSSASPHLSFTAVTDKKVQVCVSQQLFIYMQEYTIKSCWSNLLLWFIGVWGPIERDRMLQRWERRDDMWGVRRRPEARNAVAREGLLPMVSIWIDFLGSSLTLCSCWLGEDHKWLMSNENSAVFNWSSLCYDFDEIVGLWGFGSLISSS